MHSLKRALVVTLILLTFSAISAFANGQHEASGLNGTITSVQPNSNGKTVTVALATKDGTVTVTVDTSLATAASLHVGQKIGVKGDLQESADGSKEMEAHSLDVDGAKFDNSPDTAVAEKNGSDSHDAAAAGGSGEAEASHQSDGADSGGHGSGGASGDD